MSDNNQTPDYQEILDKYAADLQTPPKIIPDIPEVPETLETPETLIPESIPAPEPELAISEPIIPPETIVPPEPIISPETIPTVSPELPPTPPVPEFTPEPQFESTLPPEITPEAPKKENNFFKYLFFISLVIFLGVLIAVVLSFINSQKSQPSSTATPTSLISPTSTPGSVCEINDQKYAIDETFTADDGCNTCTCNSDLTIACTEKTCDITPTKSATNSAVSKDWKTYVSKNYGFSLSYPISWGDIEDNATFFSLFKKDSDPMYRNGFVLKKVTYDKSTFLSNYIKKGVDVDNSSVIPENFSINGINTTKIKIGTAMGSFDYIIYVDTGKGKYQIQYAFFEDNSVLHKEIDSIISTIKFL